MQWILKTAWCLAWFVVALVSLVSGLFFVIPVVSLCSVLVLAEVPERAGCGLNRGFNG